MARKHEHASRVDQLHAELRVSHRGLARRSSPPAGAPQFIVEPDGTVRDQLGAVVYKPPPAKAT